MRPLLWYGQWPHSEISACKILYDFTTFTRQLEPVMFSALGSSILVELKFGVLVFVEGGKPENSEKNPRSRDKKQ